MGCLKKIFQSIILCFAIIGFISVGGNDFIKTKMEAFKIKHPDKTIEKANKIADFSGIGEEFEISKTASLFGYNGVIAEHRASGQKMILLDSKGNDIITPEDIESNEVDKKIEKLTKKFKYSAIKISDLEMGSKGTLVAFGKSIPFVKFRAKITKLPFGDIDGMIASYKTEDDNKLLISVNEKDKYSQLITQEFFKKVKK